MYIQMPHHVGWWFLGAFLAQHYHRIMQLPLHYFCTGFAMVAGYGWYLAPLDLATDQIATTTGAFRVCMLLFMPLLVLGFARAGSGVPHVGPVLRHLGNATYGLYLLHPLVYWSLNWQRLLPAHDLLVPVILGVTFIAAWASYTAIERPALRCNPFRIRP
jgi:peptidoglycan/LPS O-acetylase OafA/YrhL